MSHFTQSTVYTFSSDPKLCEAWQTIIIRDAVSNPFLLHGILAISAQHLASLPRPSGVTFDYERHFRHHQDAAITQYREALQSFHVLENEEFAAHSETPWMAGPVFALSVIIAIIAVAGVSDSLLSPAAINDLVHDEPDSRNTEGLSSGDGSTAGDASKHDAVLSSIVSIFVTIRGTRSLVSAAHAQNIFRDTVYRFLMDPYKGKGNLTYLSCSAHISTWYARLKTACLDDLIDTRDSHSHDEYQLCVSAIDELEYIHREAISLLEEKKKLSEASDTQKGASTDPDIGWFLKWTALVSHGFLSLLRRRSPASLVILAQFAAICGQAEHQWYLRNWVSNAIAAIEYALGDGKAREWVSRIVSTWAVDSRLDTE